MTEKPTTPRHISRTPSLRELRKKCPENVVILPTAASRQVQQRYNRDFRAAAGELRELHAARFRFAPPHAREALRRARRLREAGKSPATLILDALLRSLEPDTVSATLRKLRIATELRDDPIYEQAYELARLSAPMTIAERFDLENAFEQLDD